MSRHYWRWAIRRSRQLLGREIVFLGNIERRNVARGSSLDTRNGVADGTLHRRGWWYVFRIRSIVKSDIRYERLDLLRYVSGRLLPFYRLFRGLRDCRYWNSRGCLDLGEPVSYGTHE